APVAQVEEVEPSQVAAAVDPADHAVGGSDVLGAQRPGHAGAQRGSLDVAQRGSGAVREVERKKAEREAIQYPNVTPARSASQSRSEGSRPGTNAWCDSSEAPYRAPSRIRPRCQTGLDPLPGCRRRPQASEAPSTA